MKKVWRLWFIFYTICVLLCACSGQPQAQGNGAAFEMIDDQVPYENDNGGKLYTDISEHFDITVHPVVVNYDENHVQQIVYAFDVFNKTDWIFQDFEATLWMDEEMEKYIQSGMTVFSAQKLSLIPKAQMEDDAGAWGVHTRYVSLLVQPKELEAFNMERSELLSIAGTMKLQLTWKDGYENYEFHVDVIDKTEMMQPR